MHSGDLSMNRVKSFLHFRFVPLTLKGISNLGKERLVPLTLKGISDLKEFNSLNQGRLVPLTLKGISNLGKERHVPLTLKGISDIGKERHVSLTLKGISNLIGEKCDTHDPKGHCLMVLLCLRKRSKIIEIVAAQDIVFALAQSGIELVQSRIDWSGGSCNILNTGIELKGRRNRRAKESFARKIN
ncbi:Detected protein of unknown function [Hibiscus syriacus]|uniref:Uncharacterized protein n=1 Tax=Hibiscus syriacus TaxID=106335 RepID=A0A6A3B1S0_HIBSY|nr:Detected protein of unknown function [Hibiscus syriacus]